MQTKPSKQMNHYEIILTSVPRLDSPMYVCQWLQALVQASFIDRPTNCFPRGQSPSLSLSLSFSLALSLSLYLYISLYIYICIYIYTYIYIYIALLTGRWSRIHNCILWTYNGDTCHIRCIAISSLAIIANVVAPMQTHEPADSDYTRNMLKSDATIIDLHPI